MTKIQQLFLAFIFGTIMDGSQCFPKSRTPPAKMLFKEEKQLQNGTIVGKYSYFDKEGGAVGVKYFADKDGYGVELKSLKISTMQPDSLKPYDREKEFSPLSEIVRTLSTKNYEENVKENQELKLDQEDPINGNKKKSKNSEKSHKSSMDYYDDDDELDDDSYDDDRSTEKNNNCFKKNDGLNYELFVDRKETPKKYHKQMYKAYKTRRDNGNIETHNDNVYFCDQV